MKNKYFLRTQTPEEMDEKLILAGICFLQPALVANGIIVHPEVVRANPEYDLVMVGKVRRPTGLMVLSGDLPIPHTVELEGWHANLLADLTEEQLAMLPIILPPNNPSVDWA